ncbi:MAG: hypothetical protein LBG88_03295 [Christensenellaceae bacterium]|jgi:predicted  nucleic acid-binding Zn-ribbon protein|nr:hypothetical protein [Christensenellaceae bacterium]
MKKFSNRVLTMLAVGVLSVSFSVASIVTGFAFKPTKAAVLPFSQLDYNDLIEIGLHHSYNGPPKYELTKGCVYLLTMTGMKRDSGENYYFHGWLDCRETARTLTLEMSGDQGGSWARIKEGDTLWIGSERTHSDEFPFNNVNNLSSLPTYPKCTTSNWGVGFSFTATRYFESPTASYKRITTLQSEITILQKEKTQLNDTISGLQIAIDTLEGRVTAHEATITELNNQITAKDTEISGYQADITRIQGEKGELEAELGETIQGLENDITGLNNDIAGLNQDIIDLIAGNDLEQAALVKSYLDELDRLNREHDAQFNDLTGKINALRQQIIDLNATSTGLLGRITTLTTERNQARTQLAIANAQIEQKDADIDDLERTIARLRGDITGLLDEREAAQTSYDTTSKELQRMTVLVYDYEDAMALKDGEIDKLLGQINARMFGFKTPKSATPAVIGLSVGLSIFASGFGAVGYLYWGLRRKSARLAVNKH